MALQIVKGIHDERFQKDIRQLKSAFSMARLDTRNGYYFENSTVKGSDREKIFFVEKNVRVVMLTAFSLVLTDFISRFIAMVRSSNTLEGRAKYGIISNLRSEPKALQICDTLEKRIGKFYDELPEALACINFHSQVIVEDDMYEAWAMQSDVARECFGGAVKDCLKALNKAYKQMISPFDTVAFYKAMQLCYLAGVYDNYLRSFAQYLDGSELKAFRRLNPYRISHELTQWLMLRTKDGKRIAMLFNEEDYGVYHSGKPFIWKHKREEFYAFYPCPAYHTEELNRVGYEMEKAMFSFDNISKIRASVGADDTDLKKLFQMDYACLCLTTFYQYYLIIEFRMQHFEKCLEILPKFKESIPLYRGKQTKPVVGFINLLGRGIEFVGVWNSAGEASRECSVRFMDIAQNMRKNDSKEFITKLGYAHRDNRIWFSIERFERFLHDLIKAQQNESA